MEGDVSIEFQGVSFSYGGGAGLFDLSWKVEDGGFAAVMGCTGSGKSTLLRLLCALAKPDSGRILIDGRDAFSSMPRRDLRRKVGFVFQFPERQLFETTVLKEVCFGMKNLGFSKEEREENAKWALEKMGFDFDAVKGEPPLALSGGQKRRVAIASVIASKPSVLLLDEPDGGLDPAGRERLIGLLRSLNAEGATLIMVTHNSRTACEAAKTLLVLKDGRKWKEGPVEEAFASDLSPAGVLPPPCLALSSFLCEKGLSLPPEAREGKFLKNLLEAARRRGNASR